MGRVTYIAVFARVQCREPKTGQKKFNSIVKTIGIDYLVIIYLCCKSTQYSTVAKYVAGAGAGLELLVRCIATCAVKGNRSVELCRVGANLLVVTKKKTLHGTRSVDMTKY